MPGKLNDWWERWLIAADEATTRAGRVLRSPSGVTLPASRLQLSILEPRVLFSATPIDPASLPGGEEVATVSTVEITSPEIDSDSIESIAAEKPTDHSLRELVIIDSQVPDLQQLLDDLSASGPATEVFVLEADRDGVDQITEILESRTDIAAIHIVTHAENGAAKLGDVWLGESNVDGYAGQIASWSSSLTTDADILLYGCDLAGSVDGRSFIDSFSALSGADVAASMDDTGHAAFGANWDLEYATGRIESEVVFSSELQHQWEGKLATITVDTFADVVDGVDGVTSLREAITLTNAGGGGDTIILDSGTYSLTIDTLDITQSVIIEGVDARSTIIDASGLGKRAFHLQGTGSFVMSGMTIEGGSENNGGAIFVDDSTTLNLSNALLQNNSSDKGGAIHVHGTAHLDSVLLFNNSVTKPGPGDSEGGAIHFGNADGGSLTNVTISGNSSEDDGGGLWTDTDITITNSTITANDADSVGGLVNDGATVTLSNTIVAGNTSNDTDKDVLGAFSSNGFNLIEVVGGATGFGGDTTGVSANLAALADNGGQTDTHALLGGSVAIDAGTNTAAPVVDQRGFMSGDGRADIGAYQSSGVLHNKIYWTDNVFDKIQRSDLDGSNVENVLTSADGINNPTEIVIDSVNSKMYWGEYSSGNIRRANLDGSGIETLYTGTFSVVGLALDISTNTIYWTENQLSGTEKIRKADMDGGGPITTLSIPGLEGPSHLELDLPAGKIYWTDDSDGEIKRADLDGGNDEVVVSGLGTPRGLKLDLSNRMMYWTDWGTDKVQRANMDGPPVIEDLITTGQLETGGIEVDIANGMMYWADHGTDKILRADLNGPITAIDMVTTGLSLPYGVALAADFSAMNTAPTDISLDSTNVDENDDGAVIGNLSVTDPDIGDTHTWSVDDVRFEIVGTQLKLKAGQTLDHESEPSVNLTITVTDQGGAGVDYNEGVTITVDNVNEAPTDIALDNTGVDENADGAVIGNLTVTDPDVGDTHTWGVTDARFEIVGTQLRLKAGQSLDHEAEPTVVLSVTATDSGFMYGEGFIITVGDVNEVATDISLNNTSVDENDDGAIIGNLTVTDPDDGDTHTWSVDDVRFEIVGTQLKLKAGQTLDREIEPTVGLTITATDQAGGGIAYDEGILITVDNVNEAPTDIALDNVSVDENDDGAVIGNLTVTDPDIGDTHTWSVDDVRFEVVGTQLKLKAGQTLDHEAEPTLSLSITATDQAGAGFAFNEGFVITVDNVNESATDIALDSTDVDELTDGAVVGNLTVTDPDIGDTHTWSVDDVRFEIVGTQLKLKTGQSLDSVLEPTVNLNITATDEGGTGLPYLEGFIISVGNVNEAPTDITLNNSSVAENANGAIIGNLSVTDPDIGDTHTLSVDDLRFEIVGAQLKLKAGQSLDREAEPTVNLNITATDQGGAGLDFDKSFAITVDNVNEAPVADTESFNMTAGGTLASSAPGVLIGDYDPDGMPLDAVLLTGPTNGTLTLNSNGSFIYTPDAGFTGTDSFIYEAWDGTLSSGATNVTITVNPAILIVPLPPPPSPVDPADPVDSDPPDEPSDDPGEESDNADEDNETEEFVGPGTDGGNSPTNDSRPAPAEPGIVVTNDAREESESSNNATVTPSDPTAESEPSDVVRQSLEQRPVTRTQSRSAAELISSTAEVNYALMASPGVMWKELDERLNHVDSQIHGDLIVVGTAGAAASGFTVGVVAWALRTGFLASGLIAQLPAWRAVDPLLIMQSLGAGSGDEETLEELMKRQRQEIDA